MYIRVNVFKCLKFSPTVLSHCFIVWGFIICFRMRIKMKGSAICSPGISQFKIDQSLKDGQVTEGWGVTPSETVKIGF